MKYGTLPVPVWNLPGQIILL